MRVPRVHVAEALASGGRVSLSGSAGRHVSRVLRLRPGAELVLFDGRGGEYAARVRSAGREVEVDVGEHRAVERESPLALTLAQGVSRGERMDLVVQKATELGVQAIVPLLTERCVVRLDEERTERRLRHWRSVAVGACEQCGRNRLPRISAPQPLWRWLDDLEPQEGPRLLLRPEPSVAPLAAGADAATLLIGPEGGLTPEEQEQVLARGFRPLSLGPRVLRTETAALAAVAVLQQRWGDGGG